MTRNIYIALGVIVVIVVAFIILSPLSKDESSVTDVSSEPLRFGRSIALFALDGSKEIGGVDLVENTEGQIEVRVELVETGIDVSRPAHLHSGSCDALGAIIYQLNPVVDESSETALSVSGQELQSQLPLVVNVHKSADELGVNIACGSVPVE